MPLSRLFLLFFFFQTLCPLPISLDLGERDRKLRGNVCFSPICNLISVLFSCFHLSEKDLWVAGLPLLLEANGPEYAGILGRMTTTTQSNKYFHIFAPLASQTQPPYIRAQKGPLSVS